MKNPVRPGEFGIDLIVTILLWTYFTLGFIVFFAPFYALALPLPRERRTRIFRRLNHYFYRGFFRLLRFLIPSTGWRIDDAVRNIRSSVIVCNHVSYLDPILFISLFENHSTIVKDRLFRVPLFGWMLRLSGYLPSASGGGLADLMLLRMERLSEELARGGNLFVFPEGTRSRTGALESFNPGAFKIARFCRAPLRIFLVRNTDRLFEPGRFLFDTRRANVVTLDLIGEIVPEYESEDFSIPDLMRRVRRLMEYEINRRNMETS
jgi:1-acyl-sn-glycerol-3-phosphate acyltransferase